MIEARASRRINGNQSERRRSERPSGRKRAAILYTIKPIRFAPARSNSIRARSKREVCNLPADTCREEIAEDWWICLRNIYNYINTVGIKDYDEIIRRGYKSRNIKRYYFIYNLYFLFYSSLYILFYLTAKS